MSERWEGVRKRKENINKKKEEEVLGNIGKAAERKEAGGKERREGIC